MIEAKKRAVTALKFSLVLALLLILAKKGFISIPAMKRALTQWQFILPAVVAFYFTAVLGVIRWQWLLRAQNIHVRWNRTFQLTFVGSFFNIALPGAVSGDFVKAYYVGKEVQGQRARAFGSILFDRVAGLSALVVVSATAIALGYSTFRNSQMLGAIRALVTTAAVAVVIFYGFLFTVQEKHDPFLRILRRLEKKAKKLNSVLRIYESLRHYHHHRWTVVKVLLISVLIHVTIGWAVLNFARALGENGLGLLPIYVVVPLGLLVTAIPIAPAGVGTGNVAFLYFFGLVGSQRGADVFSLVALSNFMVGAIGGLIYLRFKAHEPMAASLKMAEAKA